MNLTKIPVNHIEFKVLGGHTSKNPEDTKLIFLLTMYLFLPTLGLG